MRIIYIISFLLIASVSNATEFQFNKSLIENIQGPSAIELGPDGDLYVCTVHGKIYRFDMNADGTYSGNFEQIRDLPGSQIIGMVFDPNSSEFEPTFYISFATFGGNFNSVIRKYSYGLYGNTTPLVEEDIVIGLPSSTQLQHQTNGIDFGPNGKLYAVVGSITTAGSAYDGWGSGESELSAACIEIDLEDPIFDNGSLNVQTTDPIFYDPYASDAAVKLYATGIRNAYDLHWNSNGELYTAINSNSRTNGYNPDCGPIEPFVHTPHTQFARVEADQFYGFPNDLRNECILYGANPTSGTDFFEVNNYDVGQQPESNWDPDLIMSLNAVGGNSPNGLCEYTGPTDLDGHLLCAFFGNGTIHAFDVSPGNSGLTEGLGEKLKDENQNHITFTNPLAVASHSTGKIYVADFGVWSASNPGGGIYLLEAIDLVNCPTAGESCDDGNDFTENDIINSDCICTGTCLTVGTPCDDNDPLTSNDMIDSNCDCIGSCNLEGISCDDGNPITENDIYDADCNCNGSCPPDGEVCIDDDPTTSESYWDGNCNCVGVYSTVLFVVANPSSLSSFETEVYNWITNQSYAVVLVSGSASQTSDADDKGLIIISSTVSSSTVNTKFTNVSVPIIVWEPWLFDDLNMTGNIVDTDYGVLSNITEIDFVGSHPITAGYSGVTSINISGSADASFGKPNSNADIIAESTNDASKKLGFVYEQGATLVNGSAAADTRIALYFMDNAQWSMVNQNVFAEAFEYALEGVSNTFDIELKLYLQGYFDGNTTQSTVLNQKDLIPNTQPFSGAPWYYEGTENLSTIPIDMVDWLLLVSRDNFGNPGQLQAVLLKEDGSLTDIQGNTAIGFDNLNLTSSYFFSVHSRNQLAVSTSVPIANQSIYDFTTSISQAKGSDQMILINGKACLFSGDYNGDGYINATDLTIWESDPAANHQYKNQDGDGNGIINFRDYNLFKQNQPKTGDQSIFY